jgi:dUTP pyrophosphatase
VGLLDSDYQGEVIVHLKNNSGQTFRVERGDRIAQLIFIPVTPVLWQLVTEFGFITERGTGGFGSTGDK